MGIRRRPRPAPQVLPSTALLLRAAAAGYLANLALGSAARTRVLDTRGYRWLHHVLYVGTAALTLTAVVTGLVRRVPQTALLAPAVVPLAALPHAGQRLHARVALAAAPWFAAAALVSIGAAPSGTGR